ncbi:uncharacterized protein LOC143226701 [Tachypleus tridentatus]|uniref:uncharacterized protein LOC143226701 n=1 Tax=Tachypleus tridentatus TaxID=6853 RepID=UPI003FD51560
MSNVGDNPRTSWTYIFIFIITITWESSVATLGNKLVLVLNEKQNMKSVISNRNLQLSVTERAEFKPHDSVLQSYQNNIAKRKIRNISQHLINMLNMLGNSTLQPINENSTSTSGHFSNSNLESPDILNININNTSFTNKVKESSEEIPLSDTSTRDVDIVLIPDKRIPKQDGGNAEGYWLFSWMKDFYTMSIVTPVAAGVAGGFLVLGLILVCRYVYRFCHSRKNKLRKKPLKGPIKSLRPADRIRLLAETSDDEF